MIFTPILTRILLVGLGVSLICGGYLHVRNLQLQIEQAAERQQKLEEIISAKDLQIEGVKRDIEDMKAINSQLKNDFGNAQKDVNDLREKFLDSQGRQRDFSKMANQRPKELQDRINRGTRFALRCNEIATGSPIKPEDENNNICPELIKSKKK